MPGSADRVTVEDTVASPNRAARRRARTRETLLDVAEQAFRGAAYRDVRVEDVAEEADVSIGALYSQFGSKDGLYLALVERALEEFSARMARAFDAGGSALDQVLAAGDCYLRFHLERPGSFQFFAADGAVAGTGRADGDRLAERVGERVATMITDFERRVEAALAAGEIDAEFDPRLTARFLWGAWNGVVAFTRRTDRMHLTDDEVARCLALGRRIVRDGLAPGRRHDADRSLP